MSNELKVMDEQLVTKTTELSTVEGEIITLKDKANTNDATIESLHDELAAAQEALKKSEKELNCPRHFYFC